jgi:hypothetical protein
LAQSIRTAHALQERILNGWGATFLTKAEFLAVKAKTAKSWRMMLG